MDQILKQQTENLALNDRVLKLESENTNLKNEVKVLKEICCNQQGFLEAFDAEKRACNFIITGLSETENLRSTNEEGVEKTHTSDEEKIELLCSSIEADNTEIASITRLGEVKSNRPRPIKVTLKNKAARKTFITNAKQLKGNDQFDKVFINKDTHPAFRREMGRLREAEKRERNRPENQGKKVFYDREERALKVNDVVVYKYNPSLVF